MEPKTPKDFKISAEALEKAGYKSFTVPRDKQPYCTHAYQKTVYDKPSGLKLYFINIYIWHFQPPVFPAGRKSASVNVRMYRERDSFDLNYFCEQNSTIAGVERFYRNAYNLLGCVPDRHNN